MSIWLGVGLALCSTACSATGYTLQKIAHNRHDKEVQDLKRAASQETGVTTSSEGVDVAGEVAAGAKGIVVHVRPASPNAPKSNGGEYQAPSAVASPRTDVKEIDVSEVVQTTAKPKSYLMYWQFPVGLLLLIVGTLFAAFVFGLAPQSTLAPLGSVTMILNTILSWKFLGEAFTYIDAVSIGLMACGTTVAVLFGKSNDPKYTLSSVVNLFVNRPAAWALASTAALAITAATAFVYTVGRKPIEEMKPGLRRVDVFCRAFLGAAWSGYSNFASKAVVEVAFSSVLNRSGADWQRPELYLLAFVMFASLIMQVKFLNAGLAKYDSMIVVRLYQAMLAIFSIMSGFFYFDEVSRLDSLSIGMFCLGVAVVLAGMGVGMLKRLRTGGPLEHRPPVVATPASPLLDTPVFPSYTVPVPPADDDSGTSSDVDSPTKIIVHPQSPVTTV